MLQIILNLILSIFKTKLVKKDPEPIYTEISPVEEEINYLYEHMKNVYYQHGVEWQEVNLFGLRDISNMDNDVFNDYIGIATKGEVYLFPATTDPGVYYTNKPLNEKGVAHLVLGYYPKTYRIGIHAKGRKSEHEALVQSAPVKIWRDGNNNFRKDDLEVVTEGWYGINIHRASKFKDIDNIGRWSAGCQVVQKVRDFNKLLKLIKESESYMSNNKYKFDYLLINIDEVPKELRG